MSVQALAGHLDAIRPGTTSAPSPFGGLFVLMMLMSGYDKSGIALGIGGRGVSVTIYKLIFVVLTFWVVASLLMRRTTARVPIDRGLLKLIVAFVLVQTWASLVGGLITPGGIPVSAEIYYFIQRAHFLFIPLIALELRLSHRLVLALLVGAVLIHYVFIALQFASPGTYNAFAQSVADPLRQDNSLGWTGESLDFLGLQRTSNFGAFAAAFGLLALAFRPKDRFMRRLTQTTGWLAVGVAILSPSRATLIMTMAALLAYWKKTGVLSKLRVAVAIAAVVAIVGGGALLDQTVLPEVGAVYAFVAPERVDPGGSNYGKLVVLENSPGMIARSPLFGWGQRRFADIAVQGFTEELPEVSHFYFLSVLLSSGIVGFFAYVAVAIGIARALWRQRGRDYAVMCGVFVGVCLYGFLYDAGHLDVFACFNGTAAYWALRSVGPKTPNSGA